jgi:glycerol-3-phosphate dehydrogenase (NAD(P)+)
MQFESVGVIGGGSWGTALANLLGCKGVRVDLWIREEEVYSQVLQQRENKIFLPGVRLSPNIRPTMEMEEACAQKDLVIVAVPSHVFREVMVRALPHISQRAYMLVGTKGIENQTLMLMSQIVSSMAGEERLSRYACLAGPSFAKEVAKALPTVVTVASRDPSVAKALQVFLHTDWFRVYVTSDLVGAQLCGALKNVIAIAAGLCDGLGLGHNARAALITRGLVEITRLGLKMGADARTFAGLSGLGDLVLTCTSELSRNRSFGYLIGKGMSVVEALSSTPMVAEGYKTAKSAYNLSKIMGCEMPITEQVYLILYEGKSPEEAAREVMTRSLKEE